jgi:hypothetical protein
MSNPLNDTHVELSINIFDQTQHALVRKHLTVDRLISDILREFAQELDLNRKYILIYEGRQLDPELVIGEASFAPDAELMFGYYEPVRQGTISSTGEFTRSKLIAREQAMGQLPSLRELETGQEFPLHKNPTIIGRSSANHSVVEKIDIDLLPFRESRTVSRVHAQITNADGTYYVEGLKDQRPVYINDAPLPYGRKQALRNGDRIGIGEVQFVFQIG